MLVSTMLPRVFGAAVILGASAILAGDGPPGHGSSSSSHVRFDLPDVRATPGSLLSVPVRLETDEAISMAAFSLEFDPGVLEFVEAVLTPEVLEIIERRAGIPLVDWQLESFSDNEVGWVQVSLVLDFAGREDFSIPPGLLLDLVSLTFRVKADASEGPSSLAFTRPEVAGYSGNFQDGERQVYNAARRSGNPFTPEDRFREAVDPELDDGSVFVSIIGDVGIFVRGDTNGDDKVDISDPIATLGFLFGDMTVLSCEDAADSNDDGGIDISDPIDTLGYLFGKSTGHARRLIQDETPDLLDCAR
jgi:hypothetical protein